MAHNKLYTAIGAGEKESTFLPPSARTSSLAAGKVTKKSSPKVFNKHLWSKLGSKIYNIFPHTYDGQINWSETIALTFICCLALLLICGIGFLAYAFHVDATAYQATRDAAYAAKQALEKGALEAQIDGVQVLSQVLVELRHLRAAMDIIAGGEF